CGRGRSRRTPGTGTRPTSRSRGDVARRPRVDVEGDEVLVHVFGRGDVVLGELLDRLVVVAQVAEDGVGVGSVVGCGSWFGCPGAVHEHRLSYVDDAVRRN